MKKLVTFLFLSVIIVLVLVVLAFLYVDFSSHKTFQYDVFLQGKPYGSIFVDKYVTEDKIIYKSRESLTWSLDYAAINTELFLKRKNKMPLKYVKQAVGIKGSSRELIIHQNEDKTDILFYEPPNFLSVKALETGYSTIIFSPYDLVLYMPVMERYNFWRKGAQFFEIMIPMDKAIPVLRDKLEVRYQGIEYVPAMNRRIESDLFAIGARSFPEARVALSKYSHDIVSIELPKQKMKFVLRSASKSAWLNKDLIDRLFSKKIISEKKSEEVKMGDKEPGEFTDKESSQEKISAAKVKNEEIFFENEKSITSGTLYTPEKEGLLPAIIFIYDDGPITKGEENLYKAYAKVFSQAGYMVLTFDRPGQGKSQGNFLELDDKKRIKNIGSALKFLQENPKIDKKNISFLGYRAGGYLAVKAAEGLPEVHSCILLGMPFERPRMIPDVKLLEDEIRVITKNYDLDFTDEGYTNIIVEATKSHIEQAHNAKGPSIFFLGKKISLEPFNEYSERKVFNTIELFDRPALLIVARDDESFQPTEINGLKKTKEKDKSFRIVEFRNLKKYFGEFTNEGVFKVDDEVIRAIMKWLRENKTIEQVKQDSVEQITPNY